MKAKLLGTQQATIEHIMTGGKMRIMLQSTTNPNQFTTATITLVCCKVPSTKRGEMYGEEAEAMLKEYLFRQAEVTFVGGAERHTNAYNCVVKVDGEVLNVKLLENGLAYYMVNKEVPQALAGRLAAAEARGKSGKKNLFGVNLPEHDFDAGSFGKMLCRKIVGLSVSPERLCFRFADDAPVTHACGSTAAVEKGKVGQFYLVERDGELVRARVLRVPGGDAQSTESAYTVSLIDLGAEKKVTKLYALADGDMEVPVACVFAQMAFVDAEVENSVIEGKFVAEVEDNFVGRELYAQLCGRDERGMLQVFLQASDGELDPFETLNSMVLEDGLARLRQVAGGEEFLEQMGQFEQTAVQASRGCGK